jgi:ABC-type Fe3+-hydroxamate transport system substrate-binding protein
MNPVAPQRVVSLVPSTTETVCRIGAAPRLVGCTRYCTEPEGALAGVPRLGGTKNPARDAILRQRPDLVLANAEENRPEDVAWLAERVPVLVQTPRTVREAAADLRTLATTLGLAGAARPFVDTIDAWLAAGDGTPAPARPLRVYYAIWRQPWMSVGRDTFVHDVLRLCGAENVCADEPARYPAVDPATAVQRDTGVVLLASEPWAFDDAQRDELAAARVFGAARLATCDGRDFCWHGVHMAAGLPRARALLRALATG